MPNRYPSPPRSNWTERFVAALIALGWPADLAMQMSQSPYAHGCIAQGTDPIDAAKHIAVAS